ncbi:DUF2924 domain-containing protein [Sphingomonas antarctica]|uniref:DUF2924 domain-containing protein n=1 Tax=Sphingomonas antarctica TaxID=2040274 RepID=UPI0039EB30C2
MAAAQRPRISFRPAKERESAHQRGPEGRRNVLPHGSLGVVARESLAGLAMMSPPQLRAEWRRLHRGRLLPDGLSADLVCRAVAWRMQERCHGGLPPARVRELARLAKQICDGGAIELEREWTVKPGTRLVRQWRGRTYRVLALDHGFQFEDRNYSSLTPIAREITGAAWSGPRFFGLKRRTGQNLVARDDDEA